MRQVVLVTLLLACACAPAASLQSSTARRPTQVETARPTQPVGESPRVAVATPPQAPTPPPPTTAPPSPRPSPSVAVAAATMAPAQRYVVAVDPGHGGSETGAVHTAANGKVDLLEKNVNLEIALILAHQLTEAGFEAVLTRTADTGVNRARQDLNGDGIVDNDDDLQARVDIANDAHADVLLSIHNNGVDDTRRHGTSTWYSAAHPLGAEARTLAQLVQKELLASLEGAGYAARDEGANDDSPLGKPFGHLFVTGPKTPRVARVSQMPGIVGESLYVTNDMESSLLKTERIQTAIAQAYVHAVSTFFH